MTKTTPMILKQGKKFNGRCPNGNVVAYVGGDTVELTDNQIAAFGDFFDKAPEPTPAEAPTKEAEPKTKKPKAAKKPGKVKDAAKSAKKK